TPRSTQVGDNPIIVRVSDPYGGTTTQSFVVHVGAVNLPPAITSTPVVDATVYHSYTYAVRATDPDEDTPLTFTLVNSPPSWLGIDPNTGVVSGFPFYTGDITVSVRVDDGWGGTDTQTYTLHVHNQPPNQPPEISSDPGYDATVGEEYDYQVVASDPEGQPLTYSFVNPPAGMAISTQTPGLL